MSATVATASLPTSTRRRSAAYLALSGCAALFGCLVAYRGAWKNDFGLHAAVVERLRQDLWDPADPMVQADVDSPYNTPLTVLLGLLARLSGLSGYDLLRLIAPLYLAVLLYGVYRFVRIFSRDRWAPVVALLLMLLLWGDNAPQWSGFLNLAGLPLLLAYPSTAALGLTLCWWAYLWRSIDQLTVRRWALVGTLLGGLALIHPFTAVEAGIGAVALLAVRLRSLRLLPAVAATASAMLAMLLWPYYSMIDVLLNAADLNGVHRTLYLDADATYLAALLLCVPALALRMWRIPADPLGVMFLLSISVVALGWATDSWALGRVWPLVMISGQVALAVELTGALAKRERHSTGWGVSVGAWAALTAAACWWSWGLQQANVLAVTRSDPLLIAFDQRHAWVAERVAPSDVVLLDVPGVASERWMARDLIYHGALFVEPPWPHPTLPDERERHLAVKEMLSVRTAESRRAELLSSYRVRWILDAAGDRRWADTYALEIVDGPGRSRLIRIAR